MKNLAKYIDHTLLAQNATYNQIKKLCDEAKEYDFCSVCVNSSYVSFAKENLDNSTIKVCSVVGFPLGAMSSKAKAYEAQEAIKDGADEIDMVINVGLLKSDKTDLVKADIEALREATKEKILKVILETALLKDDEIVKVCQIARDTGVDFVKTSTGFSIRGANLEDIKIMKSVVGNEIGIKASGGIRSYEKAIEMINAGATRLGTSSGIAIIKGQEGKKDY